ncbi:MAG: T9SS type A sorting domain-containing protein [Ignavibacterium sp.]|jgi:hypothetical protein|uniref:T9SS type A sorting domain-containing protein n=1 Tax=Ignavibacterium sp. TaxID=2651167 RepID=UPI003299C160
MRILINTIFIAPLLLVIPVSLAQGHGGHGGHHNPDSLEIVEVSGYAIVDTTFMHPMYYLDEDNDGTAEYHLNFGPWWYEPDSSNATRPNDGDFITITGGLVDSTMMNIPSIIVYEINGEFWRDPYAPFWNQMGHHGANGGHHMDSCHTSGFGWQHDPPQTVSVSGTAMVDTTFMMEHYYLDEDNDGTPEYFLNFGPPWYEPTSGATRPNDGDQIDIVGGLINNSNFPMIVVYEINGLLWRDSTWFGGHMGGGWMHRNMTQPMQFNTPFDELDWIEMQPGWHMGGGHHGGMQDSLFCQILETLPGSIVELGNENAFAGYEIDFFFTGMMGGGMGNMGCGEHMQFGSSANFQLHYTDAELQSRNIDESTVRVKYWDTHSNSWLQISNVNHNMSDNTVSFSSDVVGNFFILTGDSPTSVESSNDLIVEEYILEQNFPNPFNPVTTIKFNIPKNSFVQLSVYNLLGQKVADLVNEQLQAGAYEVNFDASSLSSGTYFYQLIADGNNLAKKMILLK